jgi:hypothetical protein
MLRDQIGEVKGKLTGQRVLDIEEEQGLPKIEYSFSANGRMKEVDITHMATFWRFLEALEYSMVKDKG